MSDAFVNQVTLDCLLNKQMYGNYLRSKEVKQQNKEDIKFYRKRAYNLFKEMINRNDPEDLLPDVKYAYDNFINSTIHYFKTIDRNDIIQSEYKDVDIPLQVCSSEVPDSSANFVSSIEADKLLLRLVKIDVPTLDKYVTRTRVYRKKETIIFPKQREINLNDLELKNKGLKKNNITNIYEDTKKIEEK
jgi:hypothetical protein